MLGNLSSGAEDEGGHSKKGTAVRRIVKRNKEGDVSNKPKISRLGAKAVKLGESGETSAVRKGVRRLGDGSKTPESSNVSTAGGSDSERSEKSETSMKQSGARSSIADEWNRKDVVAERWSLEEETDKGTWDKADVGSFSIEPECKKKHAYKCGPVGDDHEENPRMYSRLQASSNLTHSEMDWTKSEESAILKKDESKSAMSPVKPNDFLESIAPSPTQAPPPQVQNKGGWSLRGSWLASVSKSVASLTAQVSQNISTALDTSAPPHSEDLKKLVSERLQEQTGSPTDYSDESPRKGRKYLHKPGIDEDYRPPSEVIRDIEPIKKDFVPSETQKKETQTVDNYQKNSTGAIKKDIFKINPATKIQGESPELPKLSDIVMNQQKQPPPQKMHPDKIIPAKTEELSVSQGWDDDWSNDFIVEPVPVKKTVRKVNMAAKLNSKSASLTFLQQEAFGAELPTKNLEKLAKIESKSLDIPKATMDQPLKISYQFEQTPGAQTGTIEKSEDISVVKQPSKGIRETTELLLETEKSIIATTKPQKPASGAGYQGTEPSTEQKLSTETFTEQTVEPEEDKKLDISKNLQLSDHFIPSNSERSDQFSLEHILAENDWDDSWGQDVSDVETEKDQNAIEDEQKVEKSPLNIKNVEYEVLSYQAEGNEEKLQTQTPIETFSMKTDTIDLNEMKVTENVEPPCEQTQNAWVDDWDASIETDPSLTGINKQAKILTKLEEDERLAQVESAFHDNSTPEEPLTRENKETTEEYKRPGITNVKILEESNSTGWDDDWNDSHSVDDLIKSNAESAWNPDNKSETFAQVVAASLLTEKPNHSSRNEEDAQMKSNVPNSSSCDFDWNEGTQSTREGTQDSTNIKDFRQPEPSTFEDVKELTEADGAEIEVEPVIVKRDMYKCGSENEDAAQQELPIESKSIELSLEQPLKIAINEEHEEWNDWDQEMIVEVPSTSSIMTLETPVTEMHLRNTMKSSLPSPPYTTENQRVRGGRGSISVEEPLYIPSKPEVSKKEMEDRIKASLNVEINKFYEQDSSNEWDESEAEINDLEETVDREKSWSTESKVNETEHNLRQPESDNSWLLSEDTLKRPASGIWMCIGTTPENSRFYQQNECEDSQKLNINEPEQKILVNKEPMEKLFGEEKNSHTFDTNIQGKQEEIQDDARIEVEPVVVKRDMYKCGSEEELSEPIIQEPVTVNPIDSAYEETIVSTESGPISSGLKYSSKNSHQTEAQTQPQDTWDDDWCSGPSGSSENLSPLPTSVDPIEESHPDIRLQTKQKTVEECIQLLIKNREELTKKIEDKEKCVEEETATEHLREIEPIQEIEHVEVQELQMKSQTVIQSHTARPFETVESVHQDQLIHNEELDTLKIDETNSTTVPTKQTSSWEDDEEELSFVVSTNGTPLHTALPVHDLIYPSSDSREQELIEPQFYQGRPIREEFSPEESSDERLSLIPEEYETPNQNIESSRSPEIGSNINQASGIIEEGRNVKECNQDDILKPKDTYSTEQSDDGWGDDWSEDLLEQDGARIEVEPVVVKRDMYQCGEDDSNVSIDLLESFESRKVEGSESKRPEPIGGPSPVKEVLSADPEDTEDDWGGWDTQENESNEVQNTTIRLPDKDAVESADPFEDDWGNNDWGSSEDSPQKQDSKPKLVDKPVPEDNTDWNDFNDDWEGEEEESIVFKAAARIESAPTFKEPHPITGDRPIGNVFEKLENKNQWNWKKNWGVSLITTASKNVASITAQVSQNLTNALETGINVPEPEEMAKIVQQQRTHKTSESNQKSDNSGTESLEKTNPEHSSAISIREKSDNRSEKSCKSSSVDSIPAQDTGKRRPKAFVPLKNIVTGVTQISSKVITGGLDTLEGIGKKTITIIQENVPDVDRKVLSDILDESKQEKTPEKNKPKEKLPEFEIIFDDFQGLVHLEALDILSKQSSIKLEMILKEMSEEKLVKMHEALNEIEELCELPELSETEEAETSGDHSPTQLEDRLIYAVRDLDVEITFEGLVESWKRTSKYLNREGRKADSKELYENALSSLAEFTSLAVAKFHKLAELLSVAKYHSTATEVDALVSLTITYFWHINGLATRYNKLLNLLEKSDVTNRFITNIFLEASHAIEYIQRGFQLFVPILKIGAT